MLSQNSMVMKNSYILKSLGFAALLLVVWVWSGCSDLFDYHPYDTRFDGECDINARHVALIEQQCRDKDTLRVAFISDNHGWYSDTKDMINDINRRDSIDFVVHLGDLTDTGTTKEMVWTRDVLGRLGVPYVALIGNHDFLGTGEEVFEKMYGPLDFSFIAGRVKFVCLNTNATEYDHIAAVPNFDFIEEEIHRDSLLFDQTIVCMHAQPYSDQFNNNVAKSFEFYIHLLPRLLCCVNGHGHRNCLDYLYPDSLAYHSVDCPEHRNYTLFTITKEGYSYETIDF